MDNIHTIAFPSTGFAVCKLSDAEMAPFWHEARTIMDDFSLVEPYHSALVGNIQHEYQLKNSLGQLEILSNRLSQEFKLSPCHGKPLKLAGAWINFQMRHEFNPPHHHDGDLVVVLYLRVPYDRQNELDAVAIPPDKNQAGNLIFQYLGPDGKILTYTLITDRTFENTMIIFPAWLTHSVNPFRTSEDFRITISGNLYSQ